MTTIIFTTDRPQVYLVEEIFDPTHNPSGNVIPRPGSLVLDRNQGLLQRVVSLDDKFTVMYGPVYTSLLAPDPNVTQPQDKNIVSIVDYGNSRFYLFYDKAEHPTKLNVDKKVIVLGDDAKSFSIVKFNAQLQQYLPISLYYDTDGIYRGTEIPLIEIDTVNDKIKVPTNCHTTEDINDDEVYYMFIHDYAGTQCGSVKLYAKRGVLNNSAGDELIIEQFVISGTQMDPNGFYLYPDQDPDSLMINAKIVYNNGQDRIIPIDNAICHIYGLEGFTAAYPGQEVDLLVRYFLAPTQQAAGDSLIVSGSTRSLVKRSKLIVKDPGTNEYNIKILVIPKYLPTVYKYTLMFYLYVVGDNTVRNITALVDVSPSFDGRLMGVDQQVLLSFRIRSVFPDAASDYMYQQPAVVKLAPYSYYEKYITRDTMGDTYGIYGADSPITPRPILYYDINLEKYFIPTSKFGTIDRLLESFYYKARPLYDNSSMPTPPKPTHFTVRDSVSGVLLLSAPIDLAGYEQAFGLVSNLSNSQLLGTNCIVEFLEYHQGQYHVLYGSPVDVIAGTFV